MQKTQKKSRFEGESKKSTDESYVSGKGQESYNENDGGARYPAGDFVLAEKIRVLLNPI